MRAFLLLTHLLACAQAFRGRMATKRSPVKMAIAVFGASGGVGSEAVVQALNRGENVVAFVRDETRLLVPAGSGGEAAGGPLRDEKLKIVTGSVTSERDVESAFSLDAADPITGVVVALGGKTSDVGATMLTDGTKNIIAAMKQRGIKRISVVTSIGAGDSADQAPFFFKVLMMTAMRSVFQDKNNQEGLFLSGPGSDLEFCIVRPGGLKDEPPTNDVRIIKGEAGSIPRADVAAFCLDAVMDPDFDYIGQAPCLSTGKEGTSWTKKNTGGNTARQAMNQGA